MTETSGAAPSDTSAPARSVVLLIVAGALVIAVVVAVLVFGVARPPELISLEDQPEPAPSASMVWRVDEDVEPCLEIVAPEGSGGEELVCDVDLGEVVAWDDRGVVLRTWGMQEELRWIDPTTGEQVHREQVSEDRITATPHVGSAITSRERSGVVRVTLDDTGELLWEVSAPESYRVHTGSVSPDGRWVALVDSAQRLLLVPADGSAEPRVWSEDVPSWQAPIWEGTTVDINDG